MIYLFYIFVLIILSFHYDIKGNHRNRSFFYNLMLVSLILLAGLRYRCGIDTIGYLYFFYYSYPSLSDFSFENYYLGQDPFYVLINSIIKSIGGRFYMVQLIQSTIVNVLIFKYIRKHTSYLFSSVLFYYILSFIGYNMEIMRASISIAICLFANDYVYSKKWVKGYLLYFIALMFHVQTIVMFFFPIFRHLKLNKNSIMLLLFAFFMGIILQKMLGDYIFLLEGNDHLFRKMSTYSEDYGSMTILGMLGVIVNSIILPILSLLYLRKNSTDRIYVYIEPFVLCGVLFALMRMSVPLVSRYQEYFHVHFSILYANVIVLLAQKVGRLNKTLAISRMMIILIPWLMMNVYLYYKTQKYYPYSSIFEKNVYSNKEKIFKERDNYYVYPNHKY